MPEPFEIRSVVPGVDDRTGIILNKTTKNHDYAYLGRKPVSLIFKTKRLVSYFEGLEQAALTSRSCRQPRHLTGKLATALHCRF